MPQSNPFLLQNEIPWQPAGDGITRQVYGYNDSLMMVKVKFEKGAIGTLHQHPHTQVTYVESGRFKTTIDGEERILNQGDGFYIPPGVPHGVECLEAGILVDAFSPMREDFL